MANTLISAQLLHNMTDIATFDCRHELMNLAAGREAFNTGHIPGALFLDMDKDLSGPVIAGTTGRHPLPNRNQLAQKLRDLGVKSDQTVVAYDAGNGAFAARLWWLMRWLGHERVMVLDGGLKAWQEAELPVDQSIPANTPGDFTIRDSLTKTIEASELLEWQGPITDARDRARFVGEQEPIDPVAGHIPGACCVPFADNLLESGLFKSPKVLKAQFFAAGLTEAQSVVCYCGSGVTACHNILALVHAGFPEPTLYAGSWSEWITDPARPIAVGEAGE